MALARAAILVSALACMAECASIDAARALARWPRKKASESHTPLIPSNSRAQGAPASNPGTCCACKNSVKPREVAYRSKSGTCAKCAVEPWKKFAYDGPNSTFFFGTPFFFGKQHAHCVQRIKKELKAIRKHEVMRSRWLSVVEQKGCEWGGGSEDWTRARQDVQELDDRMVSEAPYYGWVYGMHEDGHLLVYRPESRSSFRVDTFGKTLRKPWVAVVALRGRVYAVPYNADKLLVYDPATGQVSGIDTSRVDKGNGKWKGAVVLGTKVYAVPWNAKKILMYDPETGKVRGTDTSSVEPAGPEGKKWWGVVALGDKLYAVPFNAKAGLIYDSSADVVSTFEAFSVETGSGKWAGAVAFRGKVYGVPFNAKQLLEVSPFSQGLPNREVKGIDISGVEETTFFGKWAGAVVVEVVDGILYAVPYNAKKLLKYSLSGGQAVGLDSSSAGPWVHRRWTGVVAMNGQIVAVPETGKVLTYHLESQRMQDQEVTGVGDGWTAAVALTGSVPPLACES